MHEQETTRASALGRHDGQRGRGRLRRGALAAVIGLMASLVPTLTINSAAAADAPAFINVTFEGCRGSVDSFPADADTEEEFVCQDNEYTTGNLGGGWHELDLVPHRVTLESGTQSGVTTTYEFNITADATAGTPTRTGYDYISEPVINDALSDDSCVIEEVSAQGSHSTGATTTEIYRTVTVSHDPGTTCVLDYVERLSVGSHLYPGSSLHSHMTQSDFTNGGIGRRDISIPVKEILPQSISKTMDATQGGDYPWTISKTATPASVDFENTCDATEADYQDVEITITWDRGDPVPSGEVAVTTTIFANNPSHRTITVDATDVIKSGSTVLDSWSTGPIDVPADTIGFTLGTNTIFIDAEDAVNLNDTATATYTDKVTNIPVPGTTTASASATVTSSGENGNATAVIEDVEELTEDESGTALSFAVTSVSDSSGSFSDGYALDDETTGPVTWTSGTKSGDGSVTFTKRIFVDGPVETSGELTDTAYVKDGDATLATSNTATVDITADAETTLTIEKNIPNVLDGTDSVTFDFDVFEDGADPTIDLPVGTISLTFTAGETQESGSLTLDPGVYDVVERPVDGWTSDLDGEDVDLTLPTCESTLIVTNSFAPASAQVVKVTDPAGGEAGWQMCLDGPGIAEPECVDTGLDGTATFLTSLTEEGEYTIVETPRPGWDQTDAEGCTFTVDYPQDDGVVFTCTITNTERGTVTVIKTSSLQVPPAGAFTFEIRTGASATEAGTTVASDSNDETGAVDFDSITDGLVPGDYQICETGMLPGWHSTLSDDPSSFVPDSDDPNHDNSIICVPFTLDPGEDEVINVDNTPPPGGDARTIGFWRNWSSCSGGNQDPTLDQTLALAPDGGIWVGDLFVDTCQEAVAILSKSDLAGNKRASDPMYNMAAQLLAAQLNVVAGAGTCPAATTAISQGQALLDAVGFDGVKWYGGSTVKGKKGTAPTGTMTTAQAVQANTLAGTLDAYNNNELC